MRLVLLYVLCAALVRMQEVTERLIGELQDECWLLPVKHDAVSLQYVLAHAARHAHVLCSCLVHCHAAMRDVHF
jgi:hypothetical protein